MDSPQFDCLWVHKGAIRGRQIGNFGSRAFLEKTIRCLTREVISDSHCGDAIDLVSVVGHLKPRGVAWRALLQTLRMRVFLTLSDDAWTEIAAEVWGQVLRMKASYNMSENTQRAQPIRREKVTAVPSDAGEAP